MKEHALRNTWAKFDTFWAKFGLTRSIWKSGVKWKSVFKPAISDNWIIWSSPYNKKWWAFSSWKNWDQNKRKELIKWFSGFLVDEDKSKFQNNNSTGGVYKRKFTNLKPAGALLYWQNFFIHTSSSFFKKIWLTDLFSFYSVASGFCVDKDECVIVVLHQLITEQVQKKVQ